MFSGLRIVFIVQKIYYNLEVLFYFMKKLLLFVITIVLFSVNNVSFAQAPKVNYVDSLHKYFLSASIVALANNNDTKTTRPIDIIDSIVSHKYNNSQIENSKTWIGEVLGKAALTDEIKLIRNYMLGFPEVVSYKQASSIMINNFASKYVYNSHSMNSTRERAQYATKTMFFPLLYEVLETKIEIKTQFVGFTLSYCYKDFSEDYARSKGGSVTVVVPVSELKKLQQYQISEDDFVKQCDFYMQEDGAAVKFNYIFLTK